MDFLLDRQITCVTHLLHRMTGRHEKSEHLSKETYALQVRSRVLQQ